MGYLGRSPAVGTQKLLDNIESQFNGTLVSFDLRYGTTPTYPTLSASLIVSLGGVLQEPGAAYYVSSDKIVFSEAPATGTECWILLYSQYGAAASSTPLLATQATGEPMGFEDRTHSTISFTNGTRTFSIGPNTGGGHNSYAVWTKGTKRTISATLSVQIGATTGLYYIYFDAFGDLQSKTTYFTWDTETPVAYVYWNASTSTAPFVADERHGIVLDWATHEYLHRTRGAVIAEGFSISAYTTAGDGSADAHAQFDLGNGTFFDEDLEVAISHSASPTVGTFTQVLTGAAELPVFYMSGAGGAWVRDTPTEYACKQSGTTLQYNSLSGSTWSTTPATNNRYVVSWVVATNDITAPIIAILGQDQYTSIGGAEAVKFGNLTLTNFPIVEFRPLWKVIFRTSTGFTNVPNALVANVLDLRQLSETGEAGSVVSDHGLLSGLADDDHSQYFHTSLDRVEATANISTTGNLGAANLTLTGELHGPSTFVIDPAAVGDDTGLVRIKGGLEVLGTTTTISSTTLTVADKNIVIGQGGSTLSSIDTAGIDFGSTAVRLRYNYNGGAASGLSIEGASVGIGTTTPTNYGSGINVLSINGTAGSIADFYFNGTRQGWIGTLASNQMVVDTAGATIPLILKTNNTTALTITAAQIVGIGTSDPNYQLHVTSSFAVGASGFNQQLSFTNDTIQSLLLGTGYTPLKLNPLGGNVGIGTTSPQQSLVVSSGGAAGTEIAPGLLVSYNRNTNTYTDFASYAASHAFHIGATGEKARIDSSGRLLIGTSTARTGSSEIVTTDGNVALVNDDAYSTSLARQIVYYSSTSSYGVQPTANIVFATEGDATSSLRFVTRSSPADYTERLRITPAGTINIVGAGTPGSSQAVSFNGSAPINSLVMDSVGKVGLGTSSPTALFHCFSPDNINTTAYFRLTNSSGGSGVYRNVHIDGTHPNNASFWKGIDITPTPALTAPMTGIDMSWSQIYAEARGVNINVIKNTHAGGGNGIGVFSRVSASGVNDRTYEAIGGWFITDKETGALDPYTSYTLKVENRSTTGTTNLVSFYTDSTTQRGSIYYDRTNNALTLSGNNAFRIDSNGSPRLFISSSGNVGIGTGATSPATKLEVNGTIRMSAVPGTNNNASQAVLHQTASGDIDGGSSLTFNPGEDALSINGMYINANVVRANANGPLTLTTANASSTIGLYVGITDIYSKGGFRPDADNTYSLGSSAFRWANIYSADLQLSNKGSAAGNEIDGTWGSYTIQEGEEDLYLINRRSGKKFKFILEEVE